MQKRPIRIIIIFLFFAFPVFANDIIINEIAWMGTIEDSNNEWIELKNTTKNPINLESYKLLINDKEINLSGVIDSFFILERSDDNSLPSIKANQIYTGSLKNTGAALQIIKNNTIIDKADFSNGWTCGNNETKQTCERIESEWQTSINSSPNKENIKNSIKIQNTIYLTNNEKPLPFEIIIPLAFFSGIIIIFINKSLNLDKS